MPNPEQVPTSWQETLIAKSEMVKPDHLYSLPDEDFYKVDLTEISRPASHSVHRYQSNGFIAENGLRLGEYSSVLDQTQERDIEAALELSNVLIEHFSSDNSSPRLRLVQQVEASTALNVLSGLVGSIDDEDVPYEQAELRDYLERVVGVDGIIKMRTHRRVVFEASSLNSVLSKFETVQPWIITTVQQTSFGPAHLAAQLVEFRVHSGRDGGMATLEPVVLTKNSQRALLPPYHTVDSNHPVLFSRK